MEIKVDYRVNGVNLSTVIRNGRVNACNAPDYIIPQGDQAIEGWKQELRAMQVAQAMLFRFGTLSDDDGVIAAVAMSGGNGICRACPASCKLRAADIFLNDLSSGLVEIASLVTPATLPTPFLQKQELQEPITL